MASVDARITRLIKALELRRMEQEAPVDDLSRSLFEFESETASLDEIGIAALAAATDEDERPILTLEQARRMVDDFKRDATGRRLCAFRSGMRV